MARPVRSGRGARTTMMFRITIHKPPAGTLRRHQKMRSRLLARRGRLLRKTVRFRTRRTLPPFFIFMERHRQQLQRKYPNITMVQMAQRLGRMWHRLPEEDKKFYRDEAEYRKGRRIYCRIRRRSRSRSRSPRRSSKKRAMKNLMISFTTKAANLRDFLLSYL